MEVLEEVGEGLREMDMQFWRIARLSIGLFQYSPSTKQALFTF